MPQTTMTVEKLLAGSRALLRRRTPSPELDAELLLTHVLKRPREYVLAHRTDEIPLREIRAFTNLVRRRAEGIPLPYLTGTKEFFGRPFIVTTAVMVPRPESESIIDEVLQLLDETRSGLPHPIVADIGTGSGVLAVTIATEAPRARVVATDRSASALQVARRNARKHRVLRRIVFTQSDLLTEIPPEVAPHIVVANLPYVPSDDLKRATEALETRGLTFEPQKALDGGPDGLFVIRRFFAQLKRDRTAHSSLLTTHAHHLILEHSPPQRRRILQLAYDALPNFRPREASPFVTRWTKPAD